MAAVRFVNAFCLILALTTMGLGCTTFAVTKSASADGSVFVGHTKNKTITNIGYPDWWLENAGYQYGPRVYDLKSLQTIPDVRYVGQTVNVTSSDKIGYIRQYQ